MTEVQAETVRPVKAFLGRVAVQIAISGSAMVAIHMGLRMAPGLGPWFGLEPEVVADVEAPPPPRPIVFVVQPPAPRDRPAMPEASPVSATSPALPVPEAAPQRPLRVAGAEEPKAKGVQRFDACNPACPSRDPLLPGKAALVASAVPSPTLVADRGTDYPEVPDDGLEDRPDSLLGLPGRAIGAAGRTAGSAWNKVGSFLPFD